MLRFVSALCACMAAVHGVAHAEAPILLRDNATTSVRTFQGVLPVQITPAVADPSITIIVLNDTLQTEDLPRLRRAVTNLKPNFLRAHPLRIVSVSGTAGDVSSILDTPAAVQVALARLTLSMTNGATASPFAVLGEVANRLPGNWSTAGRRGVRGGLWTPRLGNRHNARIGLPFTGRGLSKLFPMLQPVDEDRDYRRLREALNTRETERKHWTTRDYANALFRDDKGLNGYPIFEGSAGDHLAAVRREKIPVQYWGSWVDADAALNRYRSTPGVPSVMIITANNHHGGIGADPVPTLAEQDDLNVNFSDRSE